MQTAMQHPDTLAPAGKGEDTGGLGRFHTIPSEEREHNVAGRTVGTIVGLAILLGGGFYLYSVSSNAPQPVVAASQLPTTVPVN